MALFSPPVRSNGITEDYNIAAVFYPVYNDFAELV